MKWNFNSHCVLLSAGLAILLSGVREITRAETWYDPPIVTSYTNHHRDLVVGDINRDGLTDVVLKGYPKYYVYFMQADGHMVPGDSLGGSSGYRTHALLDEDRDGWLDLIGLTNQGFRLWRNDHTGHFADTGRTLEGQPPIAVGDLDGDGHDDVIAAAANFGVCVYYSTPTGLSGTLQFIDLTDYTVENLIRISAIRVADMDGNGHPDLIATGYYQDLQMREWSRIWWRLNTGGRSFNPVKWFTTNAEMSAYGAIDLTDLDGDTDLDAVCGYSGPTASIDVLRYDTASDQLQIIYSALGHGDPRFVRLDDDSIMDIVAARTDYARTRVYRGLGSGSFDLVQELHGAWVSDLGTAVTPSGKDIIAAGYGSLGEPTLAVWPWHYEAMGVEGSSSAGEPQYRVSPRVASDMVRFTRIGVGEDSGPLEVIDLNGRVVRTLDLGGPETLWDLRSEEGSKVPSGIYWLRITRPSSEAGSLGRVCVLR